MLAKCLRRDAFLGEQVVEHDREHEHDALCEQLPVFGNDGLESERETHDDQRADKRLYDGAFTRRRTPCRPRGTR